MYFVNDEGKRLPNEPLYPKRKLIGIYVIEVSELRRVYVGQSANLSNRIAQHKNVLKKGAHGTKELQQDYVKGYALEYTVVENCEKKDLSMRETAIMREYIERGWTLYNKVITTETTILNAPKEYLPVLAEVIKALDYNRITPAQLIEQLSLL